jgi:hypothetical protein
MNQKIKKYKDRFEQLLESQMGDVKPIMIEQTGFERYLDKKQSTPEGAREVNKMFIENPHSILTVLSLSTLFIPVVGPFISGGLQLLDAGIYLKEGDTKSAGLATLFALLPGAGSLLSKLGLGQISKSVMNSIVSKLSKGQKLAPNEAQIVNTLAANKELVEQELSNYTKQLANQTANKVKDKASKNVLTKVAKGRLKVKGTLSPYGGVALGYDKYYDMIWGNSPHTIMNQIQNTQPSKAAIEAQKQIKW